MVIVRLDISQVGDRERNQRKHDSVLLEQDQIQLELHPLRYHLVRQPYHHGD